MRVLVFGAGVIGCELAHLCCLAGHDVTVLARGSWASELERNGLVIRHSLQLHTTRDRVNVVRELVPNDTYDLVCVVMQHTQVQAVLPTVAANASTKVLLVGNNLAARTCQDTILQAAPQKQVAFGFLMSAGHRERERLVSLHLGPKLMFGPLDVSRQPLAHDMRATIEQAVGSKKTRYEPHMDGYLVCHAASVLPIVYLCFIHNLDLTKTSWAQTKEGIAATCEAYRAFQHLGIPLRPDGEEEFLDKGGKTLTLPMFLIYKTFVGRLMASDHCGNAPQEMWALDEEVERLLTQAREAGYAGDFANWNRLRSTAVAQYDRVHHTPSP